MVKFLILSGGDFMDKIYKILHILALIMSICVIIIGIGILIGKIPSTQTIGGISTLFLGVLCTAIMVIMFYAERR